MIYKYLPFFSLSSFAITASAQIDFQKEVLQDNPAKKNSPTAPQPTHRTCLSVSYLLVCLLFACLSLTCLSVSFHPACLLIVCLALLCLALSHLTVLLSSTCLSLSTSPHTTYYLLPATYYQLLLLLLPTTYYLVPTTYYLPPTTYYALNVTAAMHML